MNRPTYLLTSVLALSTALAACDAATGSSVPRGRKAAQNPSQPTDGKDGPVGQTVTPDDVKSRCEESSISAPTLRRLTRAEYANTLRDTFPNALGRDELGTWAGVKLGPDPLSPLEFTNDANVLLVGTQTANEILKTAKEVAELVVAPASLGGLLPCAQAAGDDACATEFVNAFVPRLYRRPITDEERDELVGLHSSVAGRSDFTTGLKWMLVSILQSPQVLYRSEIGNANGELDQYEIATQLAYTYGGTTPSINLLQKAESGALNSPEAILNEARELQNTSLGSEVLRHFFKEWAGYERVLGSQKDVEPNFNAISTSMVQETKRFIEEVVFNTNGNVKDLLTANYTFVDKNLADFYRFGSATGTELVKAERPENWGSGILAQASFLAGTSHPNHTSPIFRGLMVYSRLLCYTTEPPPGNIPTIDMATDKGSSNTTREMYEKLHLQAPCQSCHTEFDAFGYALEHFDETGRYRADEKGFPIDTAATAAMSDGAKYEFSGFEDMVEKLSNDEAVTNCVSGLLAAYAFGGGGGRTCLAEAERSALAAGEIGLREYFIKLAQAPSFTKRQR